MSPQALPPDDPAFSPEVWETLRRLAGAEPDSDVEQVYRSARACAGTIVLVRPSVRTAASAVLGAFASSAGREPARVYAVHPDLALLLELLRELSSRNLAGEVTLFHGGLRDFFRDLPLQPGLLCCQAGDPDLEAVRLRRDIPPRTPMLVLGAAGTVRIDELISSGVLESCTGGCAPHRTTSQCQGTGLAPPPGLRLIVQGRLHERYLAAANSAGAHTAVADVTEDFRREAARQPGPASGYGSWPYASSESEGLPATLPDGRPWPKISIVTPSYNQGRFIEQTILSVLHQNYPNVEYIVMDGGSTDETNEVLERYRHRISMVVSEPDRGQSHAINKGMARASGEIVTWLNSDDMLAPGALAAMAMAFAHSGADMVAGICRLYRDGQLVGQHLTACAEGPLRLDHLLDLEGSWNAGKFFHQPEVMFTREMWERAGGHVREDLHYSMDYELWLRFAHAGAVIHVVGRPMAWFRVHEDQKTYLPANFVPELRACRDAFIREHGLVSVTPVEVPHLRRSLRITLLNDHGPFYGAGIAHARLGRALSRAGHEVRFISILDDPEIRRGTEVYSAQEVLDRVEASAPDLVVAGNLHAAGADPMLLHFLAQKFSTLAVLHDFWLLTGRCAYTAGCTQYLTGCGDSCPTPKEYPALPPPEIADAWRKKRAVLNAGRRPALLANSLWTAEFARHTLAAVLGPGQTAASVETCRLSFPLDIFRPRDKGACREVLGLSPERFVVLLPASLEDKRKGGRELLEALERLDLPGLQVVTLGPPARDLKSTVEIVQLGYITDPVRIAMLHAAADVVASPSSAETFGQVCIEAIACGTPVVGYPVAAIREAILDGVTGLIAIDTSPASLAAAIHYLYRHPALRKDLGRWGRIHVENEWSEYSAYRHFFLALGRLGLMEELELHPKISFGAEEPEPPPIVSVWKSQEPWRPVQGFSGVESAPDHGMDAYRWAAGPDSFAEITATATGDWRTAIAYRNPVEGQQLRLSCNGAAVGSFDLPTTGWSAGRVLVVDLPLVAGSNILHFQFSRWESKRPLALIVTDMVATRVADADATVRHPAPERMLKMMWGAAGSQ